MSNEREDKQGEEMSQQQYFEAYLRSLDREALEECAIMLSRDAARLRRELDEERGVIPMSRFKNAQEIHAENGTRDMRLENMKIEELFTAHIGEAHPEKQMPEPREEAEKQECFTYNNMRHAFARGWHASKHVGDEGMRAAMQLFASSSCATTVSKEALSLLRQCSAAFDACTGPDDCCGEVGGGRASWPMKHEVRDRVNAYLQSAVPESGQINAAGQEGNRVWRDRRDAALAQAENAEAALRASRSAIPAIAGEIAMDAARDLDNLAAHIAAGEKLNHEATAIVTRGARMIERLLKQTAVSSIAATVPAGWKFQSADFSMPNSGRVIFMRDAAGQKLWFSLTEEEQDRIPLYVWGEGATFEAAMEDARKNALAAPVSATTQTEGKP